MPNSSKRRTRRRWSWTSSWVAKSRNRSAIWNKKQKNSKLGSRRRPPTARRRRRLWTVEPRPRPSRWMQLSGLHKTINGCWPNNYTRCRPRWPTWPSSWPCRRHPCRQQEGSAVQHRWQPRQIQAPNAKVPWNPSRGPTEQNLMVVILLLKRQRRMVWRH